MIEYKTKEVKETYPVAKICDKCGRRVEKTDIIEWQEFYHISFTGGYGSIFGDTELVEIDLCQHCLMELIGDVWKKRMEK